MSPDERIRVMIVDDHSIVRDGLKHILEQTGEFKVVAQATDGEEAVRLVAEAAPKLVLMDVMMPKMDGVTACRRIMEIAPDTLVVILTASTWEDAVVDAVIAGAVGYLPKETGREQLLSTLRGVMSGELRVPAAAMRQALARMPGSATAGGPATVGRLTQREREILTAFAMGKSYSEIAKTREIMPVTVRNAIYGIQAKLGIDTMQELVLWADRNGLLDDPQVRS